MQEEKKVKSKKINKDNNEQKSTNKEKIIKKSADKNNCEKIPSHENPKGDQVVCRKLAKLMENNQQSKRQNPNKNDLLNETDYGKRNSKKDRNIKENQKRNKKRDNSAKIEKKKKMIKIYLIITKKEKKIIKNKKKEPKVNLLQEKFNQLK